MKMTIKFVQLMDGFFEENSLQDTFFLMNHTSWAWGTWKELGINLIPTQII